MFRSSFSRYFVAPTAAAAFSWTRPNLCQSSSSSSSSSSPTSSSSSSSASVGGVAGGGGGVAGGSGGGSGGNDSVDTGKNKHQLTPFESTAPILRSEEFAEQRSAVALAVKEEERRMARNHELFEDMIVFQGGAIADHFDLGKRMMMRDFVQWGLYHYKWGYHPKTFRKYRHLMTSGLFDPVPFAALRNKWDYESYVSRITDSSPTYVSPPNLFQPFYGWVLAEYMIGVMRAKFDPGEPLIIYEIGSFNGTLCNTLLNFLAEQYPDVYETCEYHCIDICEDMIRVCRSKLVQHLHKVKLHHISIFNWRQIEPRRCFVVGIEVMSSMPHDCIVHTDDGTVYQNYISMTSPNALSTAAERWERASDPMILRYLRYTELMREESYHALKVLCLTDGRVNDDPAKWNTIEPTIYDNHLDIVLKSITIHNPYKLVWVPVGQMVMMETIAQFFPRHHAFFGDWSAVQHPMMGINGPVVQAKLRVQRDWFVRRLGYEFLHNAGNVDLCFPTDFDHMTNLYKNICGPHKEVMSMTHCDFWKTFGGDKTSLFTAQNGYNPLLEDFETFNIFTTNHPAEL